MRSGSNHLEENKAAANLTGSEESEQRRHLSVFGFTAVTEQQAPEQEV